MLESVPHPAWPKVSLRSQWPKKTSAAEEMGVGAEGSGEADERAGAQGDLEVVAYIKCGRATIEVRQVSSEPHIESFDHRDSSMLVHEILPVVERARVAWGDEPSHPTPERPAPSDKCRVRPEEDDPPEPSIEVYEAAADTRFTKLKALWNWIYWLPAIMGAISFAVPMMVPATESRPAAHAGSFGAIVALCTAAILVFEALRGESIKFRRTPSVLIGVGSMLSAYLFLASEANAHPTDPSVSLPLLWLLVLAALWFFFLAWFLLVKESQD